MVGDPPRGPWSDAIGFLNHIEGHGYGGMASFEIAREQLRDPWLFIETAPRDQTRILACDEHGDVFIVQYGNELVADCWLDETWDVPETELKYWMPLPAPPQR